MNCTHRISIAEHSCSEEQGQEVCQAAGIELRALAEALHPLVHITPSWGGQIKVQADRMIGTVHVGQLRVDVRPRMAAREMATLIRYALGGQPQPQHISAIDMEKMGLDELICCIFASELAFVRQVGLSRQYVDRAERLSVLRGRPDFLASFPWNDRGMTGLSCRFHELTFDTLDNRLVRAALERATLMETRVPTRRQLLEHRLVWSSISSFKAVAPPDFDTARSRYSRLSDHYRLAHSLAEIILFGQQPSSLFKIGPVLTGGLMLDMAELFELFLSRLLTDAAKTLGLTVKPQQPDGGALVDRDGVRYRRVRPDLVVYRNEVPIVVIDAKYKDYWRGVAPGAQPSRRIENADLYQLFFYSQRLQLRHRMQQPPTAIIVSPVPAEDERGETPMIADRFREVVWRAGQDSPSDVHLVLLPITDILRILGSRPQAARGDLVWHLSPLLELLAVE